MNCTIHKPRKLLSSHDVIFDEQVVWDWSFNEKSPSSIHIHLEEHWEDQSMQPTSPIIMTPCPLESSMHP